MAKQTFTTGQVLTAAQMTSLQQTAMGGGSTTAKTANYVLVGADAGTTVAMDAATATTITVDTGLFAAGDTVFIQNIGAGDCTITAGTATVDTAGSLILPQYDAGILYFTSASAAIFYDYIQVGAASPLTTKGDLYTYGTSDTRLGVGADGTTLVADSAEATGLKWATPATPSSGATLISRTTFTTSAAVTIDSLFSDTYENYIVNIQTIGSANALNLRVQGRYSSTTDTGSTYYYGYCGITDSSSTLKTMRGANSSYWSFGELATGSDFNIGNFTFYRPSSSGQINLTGQIIDRSTGDLLSGAALNTVSRVWGGLYIFPSSGTITGQISVYGLAKS
jgi:hypothetical protein